MSSFKKFLTHPLTIRTCRILIGLVFMVAALAKLGDLRAFAVELHNFRMAPVFTENLAALALPWIELVAALALLFKVRARSAAVVATLLMALFTVGVAQAMARGLDIECGCFGTADATRVGFAKLAENLGLLALCLVGSLRSDSE